MRQLHQIISILDNLPHNEARKEYLLSIKKNPNIGRHDLLRISCNILIDDNFVETYYRENYFRKCKRNIIFYYKKIRTNFLVYMWDFQTKQRKFINSVNLKRGTG